MKRLSATTVVLCMLLAVAPASAQEPELPVFAYGGGAQEAWADWTEIHGDHGVWYLAYGVRHLGPEGLITLGMVAKGRCHVQRGKHFMSISCMARGRVVQLAEEDFVFDPLLDTASLRLETDGFTHRVGWTGSGDRAEPNSWTGTYASSWGADAGAGAGLFRAARPSGRVYGETIRSRGFMDMSYLGESAGAGAFASTYGGPVELTRTFRIPT